MQALEDEGVDRIMPPRAGGVDRLFLPGEMEWERHARALRDGVALPTDVLASLRDAAAIAGLKLEDFW